MFLGQSSVAGQRVLRVRNWERLVSRSKGGSRANGRMAAAMLGTVSGLRNLVRRRLLNLPGGAAAYGVWILLWALASESCVPGVFLDEEQIPLTVEDLALLTDVRLEELHAALVILSGPEVRLIEAVSLEEVLAVRGPSLDVVPGVLQVEKQTSGLSEADPVACSKMTADSSPENGELQRDEDIRSRRLKVTATESDPGSGAVPTMRDTRSDREDEIQARRLKVTATDNPEDGELDKIAQQMAQLAGTCDQVDKMKRHVAAMTTGTPILTASRKGRPNGWKVNAKLNPGRK